MTRKQFFALFVVAPLALAQPPVVYSTKEEVAFVTAFNAWATTGNQNGNIVDVREIRAWRQTTHAWTRLKSLVEKSYK